MKEIKKRSWEIVDFDNNKVYKAIEKGMTSVGSFQEKDCKKVYNAVLKDLEKLQEENPEKIFSVEQIQDLVEKKLMYFNYHDAAKSYILYRAERKKERARDIFKKRVNLKPYEYPELIKYVDAIRHSYWLHTEFNYTSDIQDFKVNLNDEERSAIKNAMLAIAQIEVAVKTFWGNVYNRLPKPEIGAIGDTFAESEVRHMDAYSHLLEILGLNEEFKNLEEVPAIQQRIEYLWNAIEGAKVNTDREYMKNILLFSLFIEHVSLFSQFLIIMSFDKYKKMLKGVANAVEATSKEEQIHGMFGIDLINIIKEENPSWFDDDLKAAIEESCLKAYAAEKNIIDWIFEKGELDFLPKHVIREFIKERFNNSLESIGMNKIFTVDEKVVEETEWFDDEINVTKHTDFFQKRSTNYSKKTQSITSDDLF